MKKFIPLLLLLLVTTNGCKKDSNNPSLTVVDYDGNVYHTVTIGTQVWMVENLKVTRYNDGAIIPLVTDDTEWYYLKSGGYCRYNSQTSAVHAEGALYNWYAVKTGKLAPLGWHVASEDEWSTLSYYLGQYVAGQKLREAGTAHWVSPNDGTNSTGFTAIPEGWRDAYGAFHGIGMYTYWWTKTDSIAPERRNPFYAYGLSLANGGTLGYSYAVTASGYSVRCIKD